MDKSSASGSCTAGHQSIWIPPEDPKDREILDQGLALITKAVLKSLSERRAAEDTRVLMTSSTEPEQRHLCSPFVVRLMLGSSAFLLFVGTMYFATRCTPSVDDQGVVEPAQEQVAAVAIACLLWFAFLFVLRLTCRFAFPTAQP